MSEHGETEYGLVMPFLPVKSRGGPHDDEAFVAGWRLGALDTALASGQRDCIELMLRGDDLAQADLSAMRHGYILTTEEDEYGWHLAQIRQPAPAPKEEK